MSHLINNWNDLLEAASGQQGVIFPKLISKINQFLRPYQKTKDNFNLLEVKKNHSDVFEGFKLIYEQLLMEDDVMDIITEIPSLISKISLNFNLVCIGKWIKLHGGGSGRIFFFDDEKTTLSDRSIADFLNKITLVRANYKYFSREPLVYYKFKNLPSQDVIDYMLQYGVIALDLTDKTPPFDYPMIFNDKVVFSSPLQKQALNPTELEDKVAFGSPLQKQALHPTELEDKVVFGSPLKKQALHPTELEDKVLLDQSMILTLCSNLSYGLSKSFFKESPEEKSLNMVNNRIDIENFIRGKFLLVNKSVYDQTMAKLDFAAGVSEKARFKILSQKFKIVDDQTNPRFYYLKDGEIVSASTVESEYATLITGNHRLKNKLDKYYPEIPYKIFHGAQLVEAKFK